VYRLLLTMHESGDIHSADISKMSFSAKKRNFQCAHTLWGVART
jgi:hypothetical protein